VFALACDAAAPTDAPTPEPAPEPAADPEPVLATAEAPAKVDEAPTVEPPTEATAPEPEPAAPPPEPEEKTVLLIGSSMMATGFGVLLEKKLDAHPHVRCIRKAKSATGLARPDFYDWTEVTEKAIASESPDLVVVLLGGNDGQDLTVPKGSKRIVWASPEWDAAYRGRVGDFLRLLVGSDREVLWLGPPRTNTIKFEQKLTMMRDLQREVVATVERVEFLDLSPFLQGEEGELLRETRVGGKNEVIRSEDGIHLTMSGSRHLADQVYPEVLEALAIADAPPG
jgi:hypothetical protein